jgi:hypothetical protein
MAATFCNPDDLQRKFERAIGLVERLIQASHRRSETNWSTVLVDVVTRLRQSSMLLERFRQADLLHKEKYPQVFTTEWPEKSEMIKETDVLSEEVRLSARRFTISHGELRRTSTF